MSIEIHIRVKDSDWDIEHELAELIAEKIENIIPNNVNIPTLIIPVEDPEHEMTPLIKETEGYGIFHDISKAESKVQELTVRYAKSHV